MKILYAITELHEGGAENALWEVARRLQAAGNDIAVICLHGADGAVAGRLTSAGIPVHDLGIAAPTDLPRMSQLRALLDAFSPDVFHSWLFHANFLSRLVIRTDLPLICGLRVVEPRLVTYGVIG